MDRKESLQREARLTNGCRGGATWRAIILAAGATLSVALAAVAVTPPKSINSTSQNRATPPSVLVTEQVRKTLSGYQIVTSNDLGMHCANLDQRAVSILPPFNTLHAQAIRTGKVPVILGNTQVKVVYSAASNATDPALANAIPQQVFKTNFWDKNPRTLNSYGYDAYNPQYPPGILKLFPLKPDMGLPVPDLQRLYLGDGKLVAGQQAMPDATAPPTTNPYAANLPQAFQTYYKNFPFLGRGKLPVANGIHSRFFGLTMCRWHPVTPGGSRTKRVQIRGAEKVVCERNRHLT